MLLGRMVARRTVCIRRLAGGIWSQQMRFWRFLSNKRVTVGALIEGWSDQIRVSAQGRHVLAIQDSSDIQFSTTPADRRGLGKIKKGHSFGAVLHAMLGIDGQSGACLGLVDGQVWSRAETVATPSSKRKLTDKESSRWLAGAETAKEVLAEADMITVVNDREGDFYAHWALTPSENVHLIARVMHDHAVLAGGTLRKVVLEVPFAGQAVIELRERAGRSARKADLSIRFGAVELKRPENTIEEGLPASVALNFVEVVETTPPNDDEPIHWLLLTTHQITKVEDAWQIVHWYKQRWIIEQFFRTLKLQGLQIEDSQLATAEGLCRLIAIAAKAAAIVIQLVQARDGSDNQPASLAFNPKEIEAIDALNTRLQGKIKRQRNPHPKNSLAWAAWVIAKLGGWNEYAARPPGPITFHNGLTYFRAFAAGWAFKNV